LIGHGGTEQGGGKGTVYEPRIAPLQALQIFLAIQLVDVADGSHVEFAELAVGQVSQSLVKLLRAKDEAPVDAHAVALQAFVQGPCVGLCLPFGIGIDLAPHNPGIGQHHQSVDKHFAATIQAPGERLDTALLFNQRVPGRDVDLVEQGAIVVIVALARQQGGTQGVAHRANANLQGAAIPYQGTGM